MNYEEIGKHKSKSKIPSVERIIMSHLHVYKRANLEHRGWEGGVSLEAGSPASLRGLKWTDSDFKSTQSHFKGYYPKNTRDSLKTRWGRWQSGMRRTGKTVVPGQAKKPRPLGSRRRSLLRDPTLSPSERAELLSSQSTWKQESGPRWVTEMRTTTRSHTCTPRTLSGLRAGNLSKQAGKSKRQSLDLESSVAVTTQANHYF